MAFLGVFLLLALAAERRSHQVTVICTKKFFLFPVFQAVGGNIMTASPISDLNPVFMAAGCKLTLADKGNTNTHINVIYLVLFHKSV